MEIGQNQIGSFQSCKIIKITGKMGKKDKKIIDGTYRNKAFLMPTDSSHSK